MRRLELLRGQRTQGRARGRANGRGGTQTPSLNSPHALHLPANAPHGRAEFTLRVERKMVNEVEIGGVPMRVFGRTRKPYRQANARMQRILLRETAATFK
jgi:hypothetical protein